MLMPACWANGLVGQACGDRRHRERGDVRTVAEIDDLAVV
jgi:hypothetical protein